MSITWLDIALVILILSVLVLECRRGFGRAVFDLAGVVLAFIAAKLYYTSIAGWIHPFQTQDANQALGFAILLIPGTGIMLLLADLAYNSLLVSTDVFERVLGAVCGAAIGLAFAHALAFGIWLGTGRNADKDNVFSNSTISMEILTFRSYHNGIEWLANLGAEKPKEAPPM